MEGGKEGICNFKVNGWLVEISKSSWDGLLDAIFPDTKCIPGGPFESCPAAAARSRGRAVGQEVTYKM